MCLKLEEFAGLLGSQHTADDGVSVKVRPWPLNTGPTPSPWHSPFSTSYCQNRVGLNLLRERTDSPRLLQEQ
jgi:hypothetical protein